LTKFEVGGFVVRGGSTLGRVLRSVHKGDRRPAVLSDNGVIRILASQNTSYRKKYNNISQLVKINQENKISQSHVLEYG